MMGGSGDMTPTGLFKRLEFPEVKHERYPRGGLTGEGRVVDVDLI